MEVEVIHGQIIAKANHYQAVPGKSGAKRIIKDGKYAPTNAASCSNAGYTGTGTFQGVSGCLSGYSIVRYALTWITA